MSGGRCDCALVLSVDICVDVLIALYPMSKLGMVNEKESILYVLDIAQVYAKFGMNAMSTVWGS